MISSVIRRALLLSFILSSAFSLSCFAADPGAPFVEATRLYWQGDHRRALSKFSAIMPLWAERYGPVSAQAARLELSMGWCFLKLENFDKARKHLLSSLSITRKLHGENSAHCADSLRTLAILAQKEQRWKLAASYYQRAVVCLDKEKARSLPTLADMLEAWAGVLRHCKTWFGTPDGDSGITPEGLEHRARAIRRKIENDRSRF